MGYNVSHSVPLYLTFIYLSGPSPSSSRSVLLLPWDKMDPDCKHWEQGVKWMLRMEMSVRSVCDPLRGPLISLSRCFWGILSWCHNRHNRSCRTPPPPSCLSQVAAEFVPITRVNIDPKVTGGPLWLQAAVPVPGKASLFCFRYQNFIVQIFNRVSSDSSCLFPLALWADLSFPPLASCSLVTSFGRS